MMGIKDDKNEEVEKENALESGGGRALRISAKVKIEFIRIS